MLGAVTGQVWHDMCDSVTTGMVPMALERGMQV